MPDSLLPCTCHSDDLEPYCPQHTPLPGESDSAAWTLAQATELVFEQFITLLDGCDDDDLVRPQMVFEAVRDAWSPAYAEAFPEVTAGEMRGRIIAARGRLAGGTT